LGIE
jgi:hypothetical protein